MFLWWPHINDNQIYSLKHDINHNMDPCIEKDIHDFQWKLLVLTIIEVEDICLFIRKGARFSRKYWVHYFVYSPSWKGNKYPNQFYYKKRKRKKSIILFNISIILKCLCILLYFSHIFINLFFILQQILNFFSINSLIKKYLIP